ncbi:MAG: hypothetical protein U9R74_07500 [Pseudomonadota bacterium]|nr:hypothetical protein [Pseudomonadota bacterium]
MIRAPGGSDLASRETQRVRHIVRFFPGKPRLRERRKRPVPLDGIQRTIGTILGVSRAFSTDGKPGTCASSATPCRIIYPDPVA